MSKAQWAEILIATRRFWSHLCGLRHVAWKKRTAKNQFARDGSSTQKESSSNWHDHHRAWKNVLLPVVFHANPGLIPTFPINSSGGYEIWSPTIVKIAVAKRLEVPVGRSQE